jgi:hypothetical protein
MKLRTWNPRLLGLGLLAPLLVACNSDSSNNFPAPRQPDPATPAETSFNRALGEMVAGNASMPDDEPLDINTQTWAYDDSETAFSVFFPQE